MLRSCLYALLFLFAFCEGRLFAERAIAPPTFLIKPVAVQVTRGEVVKIPIQVVPAYGDDVKVEISIPPAYGSLEPMGRIGSSGVVYRYAHKREFKEEEDSFRFRVKLPGHAWNSYRGSIRINEPRGILKIQPKRLDFGKVPVGVVVTKKLTLINQFGSRVSATLMVPSPWSIKGEGDFSLKEGESRSFEVRFAPTEVREEIGAARVAPQNTNFPTIDLSGEGIAPFLIDATKAVISRDHPTATFQLTNISDTPVEFSWSGDSPLDRSPSGVIPPNGSATVSASIGRLDLPEEARRELHLCLASGCYARQIDIVAVGPRGGISIETSGRSDATQAAVGIPLQLDVILRNNSSVERRLELKMLDGEDRRGGGSHTESVIIPASGSIPFSVPWTPANAGLCIPSLHVSEAGKELAVKLWKIAVAPNKSTLPARITRPTPLMTPLPTPGAIDGGGDKGSLDKGSMVRTATGREQEMLAIWSPPRFEDGWLGRSLVLRWRYCGSGKPAFVIAERVIRNSLSDRTGESPSESWKKLTGDPAPHDGIWELVIPMPLPGAHVYCVYPSVDGEKMIALLTVGVSWWSFGWPYLRILLIAIFLVCLVKVIRRRGLRGEEKVK
jgi:hypothetical protein